MAEQCILHEASRLMMKLHDPDTIAYALDRLLRKGMTYRALKKTGLKRKVRELKRDPLHGLSAEKILLEWRHDPLASTARPHSSTSSGHRSDARSDTLENRPTSSAAGKKRLANTKDEGPAAKKILTTDSMNWADFRIPRRSDSGTAVKPLSIFGAIVKLGEVREKSLKRLQEGKRGKHHSSTKEEKKGRRRKDEAKRKELRTVHSRLIRSH